MNDISKGIKSKLYNKLKKDSDFLDELENENTFFLFLRSIWDIDSMPSTDDRFKNATEDILQHMIRNNDWDYDTLFMEKLELLEQNEKFILFIETVVSPQFRKNEGEIIVYRSMIVPLLEREQLTLSLSGYNEDGLPIYKIVKAEENNNYPHDVKKNLIPFFVEKTLTGQARYKMSHQTPPEFPSFVLAFNDGWNDFTKKTEFHLFFYKSQHDWDKVGTVKIMSDDESSNVIDRIPNKFYSLDPEFCSLGQSQLYYSKLKDFFQNEFTSVVYALNDAAFNTDILDKFESTYTFINSLIRYDENERLLREIKYILAGYDMANLYHFKYEFWPKFSEESIKIDFSFDSNIQLANRIYAIIGKNGVGKTQLITSLPTDISEKKEENFFPRAPLFSKVITVSYSIFDKFDIPRKSAGFNYVYCGLRNEEKEQLSQQSLLLRFHKSWKNVEKIGRMEKWKGILTNFLEPELVDSFIIPKTNEEGKQTGFTVDIKQFNKIKDKFSSGQSIILYIITEIVSNIRYDSLLLYDEPETHLHPNAISQLMNTIYKLVTDFKSYCILATHSPLIIRELLSRNVYVMSREENIASIRRIGIESFGENLSTLTEEVFGNKDIPKNYKLVLRQLVSSNLNFDEIVNLLEVGNAPLSLNARIYLKTLTNSTAK